MKSKTVLIQDCQRCPYHKFRVVSMVLDSKDAGHQCVHPSFENEVETRRKAGDTSILKTFRKLEDLLETPDWCPLDD